MKAHNKIPFIKSHFILVNFLCLIAGCVGAQFTETAPIRSQIGEQHAKMTELMATAERDYLEKTYLVKNLGATAQPDVQTQLHDQHAYLGSLIENMKVLRENLDISKANIMKLTKGKTQISSKDPAWNPQQSFIQSFNTNMEMFNKALANYSRESTKLVLS